MNKLESWHEWRRKMECSEPKFWNYLLEEARNKNLSQQKVMKLFEFTIKQIFADCDIFNKIDRFDLPNLIALRQFAIKHFKTTLNKIDIGMLYDKIIEESLKKLMEATTLDKLHLTWEEVEKYPEIATNERLLKAFQQQKKLSTPAT